MRDESGIEEGLPPEGESRADRKHNREYIVLRAVISVADGHPFTCGLMDLSVSGAKIKFDDIPPPVGEKVNLKVEQLKIHVSGTIIRTYQTPSGVEVAVKFDRSYDEIPSRLLDYKLRSAGRRSFR